MYFSKTLNRFLLSVPIHDSRSLVIFKKDNVIKFVSSMAIYNLPANFRVYYGLSAMWKCVYIVCTYAFLYAKKAVQNRWQCIKVDNRMHRRPIDVSGIKVTAIRTGYWRPGSTFTHSTSSAPVYVVSRIVGYVVRT